MIPQKIFRPIGDVIEAALAIVPPNEHSVRGQLEALARRAAADSAASRVTEKEHWLRFEEIAKQTKGMPFSSPLVELLQGKTDYRIILLRRDLRGADLFGVFGL